MSSHGDTLQAEIDAYSQMIDEFGDDFMFACVSDTRNIEVAVRDIWGGVLRDRVLAMKAKLMIRPDSGDPVVWIPRLLNILAERFGYTVNKKGYKVLNPKVGLIQGDGIELSTIPLILNAIKEAGFAISNVAFGMGGGLLQKVNRDTFKFAMKMSAILRSSGNGRWQDVYKSPITDAGKVSKKGIQDCFVIDGLPVTKGNLSEEDPFTPSLLEVEYHFEKGMDVPYIRPTNEDDIFMNTEKSRAYIAEHLVPN
jgi:nicotinamide phosphoribosyltransferase